IEISQETAVINDLPDEYYDYMRYLFADVVGFNRTYQWYGSYTDSNSGGIPIEGATERKFVPKDFQQYPYYYCKVVSTDVGYDPIEIKTGATKYMDYSGEIPSADYSRLDEVLATIPDNLSVYTDESVAVLNGTLNEIDRNLDASSQSLINEYINNVSEAIASLRLKKYKITFVVDENTKYEYLLEYGEKISLPEDPQKEGYIFKGWTEGVSDTMPACDLTVFAIFEKQGNLSVEIKNYVETRTVCYKTTIIFTAETNDLPDDAAVVWYENGELVESGNRVAKLRATKDFTIQAKVIDNDGNVIAESAVENVKVKHTFIAKLVAFFKMLFGRLPVIEQ
ncbi:MAG: InlB B-repeat-containing protein, partial [Ruminococcus sp.]|nr:InlB B-repeat-containing protein [Ruminococcus sp.]